jgi:hypothetical protein
MMHHPLHCHPGMETELGVDDDHVIVDKEAWFTLLQTQLNRPLESAPWWVQVMN